MDNLEELKYLTQIFNQLNIGFVITDPSINDNPIIFVNDYVEKLTGYSKYYFIGKNCRFLQKDDTNQEAIKEIRTAINEEKSCFVVLRNYKKNNELFINELSISPIFKNDKLVYFIGIQKDVTLEYILKEDIYTKNLIQKKELDLLNTQITKLLNSRLEKKDQ